jgi:hypothetical protein
MRSRGAPGTLRRNAVPEAFCLPEAVPGKPTTGSRRTGAWYYRLDTLNVCYGKGSAEVFLGPPAHGIDERSQLR